MTTPALQFDAATETYVDVEQLIWHTVHRFYKRHGGDLEELFSRANVIYMDALEKHNLKRAKFTTYLVRKILWGLTKQKQEESIHAEAVSIVKGDALKAVPALRMLKFDVDKFVKELSVDAATVARLTLETPGELLAMMGMKKGLMRARSKVIDYFCGLGWDIERVADSFQEIGEVLAK